MHPTGRTRYVYVDYEPEPGLRVPHRARNAEIMAWVSENHGLEATSAQVTQVKKDHGIVTRGAQNHYRAEPREPVDVPAMTRVAIEAALRYFGMLR